MSYALLLWNQKILLRLSFLGGFRALILVFWQYCQNYGIDLQEKSYLLTVVMGCAMIGPLAGGLLGDRFGYKKFLIFAFILDICGWALLLCSSGWVMSAAGLACTVVSIGIRFHMTDGFATRDVRCYAAKERFDREKSEKMLQVLSGKRLVRFNASLAAAGVLGWGVLGLLGMKNGVVALIAIQIVVSAVSLVIACGLDTRGQGVDDKKAPTSAESGSGIEIKSTSRLRRFCRALRHPSRVFWLGWLLMLMEYWGNTPLLWLQPYFAGIGLSAQGYTLAQTGCLLFSMVVTSWAKNITPRWWLLAAIGFTPPLIMAFLSLDSIWVGSVALCAFFVGGAGRMLVQSQLNSASNERRIASDVALAVAAAQVLAVVLNLRFGSIMQTGADRGDMLGGVRDGLLFYAVIGVLLAIPPAVALWRHAVRASKARVNA